MAPARIAITPGEPAGIGPDIVVQLAQDGSQHELVAIADPSLLIQRANLLNLPLKLREFTPDSPATALNPGELAVLPIALKAPCQAGQLNKDNAHYVIETLRIAVELCQNGKIDALATAPVQKSIINDAGISFTGHTEFLAELCQCDVVMMLATQELRVALATTHLPLRDVPDAISTALLDQVIKILHKDLQNKFSIPEPRILIAGLNPHAGESGHMGKEEIDTMIPVIESLKAQGMALEGPLPADTLFTEKYLSNADAVLAMYHDQGLPVLKHLGFGRAINVTLGLPIIRTSVDHGTALDLAGSGQSDYASLRLAVEQAAAMANSATPRQLVNQQV